MTQAEEMHLQNPKLNHKNEVEEIPQGVKHVIYVKKEKSKQFEDYLFFEPTLYLYQSLLQANEEQEIAIRAADRDFMCLYLAEYNYNQQNYQKAICLLKPIYLRKLKTSLQKDPIYQASLYIIALAYRQGQNDLAAEQAFKHYLHCASYTYLPFQPHALFELSQLYYKQQKLVGAKECIQQIIHCFKNSPIVEQAYLLLANIQQVEGHLLEAKQNLAKLETSLAEGTCIKYQVHYKQGEILFDLQEYKAANEAFEKSLFKQYPEQTPWYFSTLHYRGLCLLKLAEETAEREEKYLKLEKAEKLFKYLVQEQPDDTSYLDLACLYLVKMRELEDSQAIYLAKQLLENQALFTTREGQAQALFLRIELTSSQCEKAFLYEQLTQVSFHQTVAYKKGWYYKGLNECDQARLWLNQGEQEKGLILLAQASASFEQAYQVLKEQDPSLATLAIIHLAKIHCQLEKISHYQLAFTLLDHFLMTAPFVIPADLNAEIYYLHALTASQIALQEKKELALTIALDSAKKGLELSQNKEERAQLSYLLATLFYQHMEFSSAYALFLTTAENFQTEELKGLCLFWAAKSLEKENLKQTNKEQIGLANDQIKALKRQIFEQCKTCSCAAESYFTLYTYTEYLQGEKTAIKHLQAMPQNFPSSLYVINALYLLALDLKRDRKSKEGKWICKKNSHEAIDTFYEAEKKFDLLYNNQQIPKEKLEYYLEIRYRATLERALANLAMADESQGAKRQIYLDYTVQALEELSNEFKNSKYSLASVEVEKREHFQIKEETSFYLAQTFLRLKEDTKAVELFSTILETYRSAKIKPSYFLSRSCYELAKIAMCQEKYLTALHFFSQAEETGKGKTTQDQKIDLWIQQSLCHKALKNSDQAMLILSQAINDEAISSLRIKAMYLRAEIYEMQGRYDLARKQLEATSNKGGEWSLKAKQKLDCDYAL